MKPLAPQICLFHEASNRDERKAVMGVLAEGDIAPDFELPTDGSGTLRLSELRGKKVILYFYPADDTKGCTTEAVDFTAGLPQFERLGAVVVGISPDSTGSHDKFKAKHKLGVTLAADVDRTVIERYGVWREKMLYGRKSMGVIRSTFLVGPDGKIQRIWRNVRVNAHVAAVLEAIRTV
jgi:thioredoxin-dependent peroxiredoxin